jgi:hypothetical protein
MEFLVRVRQRLDLADDPPDVHGGLLPERATEYTARASAEGLQAEIVGYLLRTVRPPNP